MEATLRNEFCELTMEEMQVVDGGNGADAAWAFTGCVLLGIAPAIGVFAGIGATMVVPAIGISAGVGAYATVSAAGAACLDLACK